MATAPAVPTLNITSFYGPWAKQVLFHSSGAKYRLMVGGQGSGKSRPLLMEGIFHALEYPGSESIILRLTVPDLKRTVISKFQADIPKELYERYNESDRIVWFHPMPKRDAAGEIIHDERGQPVMVQSKLYFHSCETEKDTNKYLSTEFVFIGFEEMGEFPFAIWDALGNRNRCSVPGSRPCMAGATNPFGIGWSWIKKLFVLKKPLDGMDADFYDPEDYEYFHSTVLDNPILSNDPEYVRKLMASPNRDVVFHGKLDAVSGLYFENYVASEMERHKSEFIWQSNQPVWVGWDYGFQHYAVIVFMTKALLKRPLGKPKVVNVLIRELILTETTPENQARTLIAAIPRHDDGGYRWQIDKVHLSWERFNRIEKERTIADDIGDVLAEAGLPRPMRSPGDRVAGWTKMFSMMESGQFYILKDECPTICEALPALPRDDKNIEDVKKPKERSLYDDCGDAVRYAFASVMDDMVDKPAEERFKEELDKIKDPVARFERQFREYNRQKKEAQQSQRPGRVIPSWMARMKKPK